MFKGLWMVFPIWVTYQLYILYSYLHYMYYTILVNLRYRLSATIFIIEFKSTLPYFLRMS